MCEEKENVVLPLIGGIIIGVAIGLLISPRSGKENRELITNYAKELIEKVKTKIEETKGQRI